MPDSSLSQAIVVVNAAVRQHGTEATRILFDHYRTSRSEAQDAFVMALIGEVVAGHAMRAAQPVEPAESTDQPSWSERMRAIRESRTCTVCGTVKIDADGGVPHDDLPYDIREAFDLLAELEDAKRISRVEYRTIIGGFIKPALFGPAGHYVPAWSIERPAAVSVSASEDAA